jgi:hypothetical protein
MTLSLWRVIMEFERGDLVEMHRTDHPDHRGLFLVLRRDKDGDPVVQVLRPRPSSSDYVGEVAAFAGEALRQVAGER